jgi:hypothetical protein
VIALALTIGLAWFAASDEPLNPEAKKLIEQPFVVPPEKNMYFSIWGLPSSPEKDAATVGRSIVDSFHKEFAQKGPSATFSPDPHYGENSLQVPSLTMLTCPGPAANKCMDLWLRNRKLIEEEIEKQALFLSRYRALREYDAYEDMVLSTPSAPIPRWQTVIHLSRLTNAQIAFDMVKAEKRSAALLALEKEMALWRLISRDSSTLIARMIASAALQQKYELLSQLLAAHPEIVRTHEDQITRLTAPLSREFADMRRVFEGEFRLSALLFLGLPHDTYSVAGDQGSAMGPWTEPVLALLYKRNETVNKHYRFFSELGAASTGDSSDIWGRTTSIAQRYGDFNPANPADYVHNPMGRILTAIVVPNYGDYIYRDHDLIATSRVVELQRRIILEKIPPGKIVAFLDASDRAMDDPYTKAPMRFDPAKGTLSFQSPRKLDPGQVAFFAQVAPPDASLVPAASTAPAALTTTN